MAAARASTAALLYLWLAQLARAALGFSAVRCTAPICSKDQRAVRKLGAPKIWAEGCNVMDGNSSLHRCCVEKEICMRTCGMAWSKCSKMFVKCADKSCGIDVECMTTAEAADVLITGGENHMTACKAYRDVQRELCDCVPSKAAKDGATQRLTDFYAAYKPDRLDEGGNVRDVEEVWKKWQGREPELFFELTRKYSAEAVEMRDRPQAELARLRAEAGREEAEELASRKAEEELARTRAKEDQESRLREASEEDQLQRRLADERSLAEAELARQKAEEELARRRAEVARLRAEKAAAIAGEDFMRAKELKAQLLKLDPKDEL